MSWFDREYFQPHEGKKRYHEFLLSLLRKRGIQAGRILDVGAGTGILLESIITAGHEAAGIEIDPEAARSAAARSGAQVFCQSAETPFPLESSSFDAVFLLDVIEHLRHPEVAIAEIGRCLRPGGVLVVITLNAWSIARLIFGRKWSWYQDPTHVDLFTSGSLRALVETGSMTVDTSTAIMNFTAAGESTAALRPFRRLMRVVRFPLVGDSLLVVATKR